MNENQGKPQVASFLHSFHESALQGVKIGKFEDPLYEIADALHT
jgi:hypothetical protein